MEDQRLVQLALNRGFVTAVQVDKARSEQKVLADRGVDHGLYFILQDLGFLTDDQARQLRQHVSSSQVRALEIEGYLIEGRLGSGGMGDVFRAKRPAGAIVAIKLLSGKLAQNPEYVQRFEREARATMRLAHPHIVRTISTGESLGTRYLLMELVDGPSLKSWLIDKGKLDQERCVALLLQMSSALRHAWEHGVLHRDVKPANIILGPPRPDQNEPFCSKLCDFGLARVWQQPGDDEASHGQLTGSGLALGTPHYMSPEQASGEHDVDQRSDIYGLGATLYHALLGQTMYSGKSSAVIMYKQVTEVVDLEQLRRGGIHGGLVDLLGRMLEKRRERRIATWAEVEAIAAGLPIGSVPAPTPAPAAQPAAAPAVVPERRSTTATGASRRRSLMISLAVAGLITLALAATAGLVLGGLRGSPRADPATFPMALAAITASEPAGREIRLAPGLYRGPWRLGAAHRGVRLVAEGPGVVLEGAPGDPALACSPGLVDALVQGLSIRAAPGMPAIEAVGGCHIELEQTSVDGDLLVMGGALGGSRLTHTGRVTVSDRGSLSVQDGRLGSVTVERGELRLQRVLVSGTLAQRGGTLELDGVRVAGVGAGAALALEGCRAVLRDVVVESAGVGLACSAAEITEIDGLTVRSNQAAIAWTGPRDPAWVWSNLSLSTPPTGIPQPPPGAGARPDRLPP